MNYSGDGLLWRATKKRCQKLDPYNRKFKARKKSCKKKGYPIKLKQPKSRGSEYSFTVTDEKREQMQSDGRLEQLQSQGVRVHGGADPLYFEWHNAVENYRKQLPKRTLSEYQDLFPYLDMNALNALGWFYSGQNFAQRHEAALLWISQTQDTTLLNKVKDFYNRSIKSLKATDDSQKLAKALIDTVFDSVADQAGTIGKLVLAGKTQLENSSKNVRVILDKELEQLNKRLKPSKKTVRPLSIKSMSKKVATQPKSSTSSFVSPIKPQVSSIKPQVSPVTSSDVVAENLVIITSEEEEKKRKLRIAIGSLVGISAIFLIYSLVSD